MSHFFNTPACALCGVRYLLRLCTLSPGLDRSSRSSVAAGAAGGPCCCPGGLCRLRRAVVGLAACRPPGGLMWALWAVVVALLLPSVVAAVRGCVAVSVAGPAVGPAVHAAGGRGSCRAHVLRLAWWPGLCCCPWVRLAWSSAAGPASSGVRAVMDRGRARALRLLWVLFPLGSHPQVHSTFSGRPRGFSGR